MYDQGKSVTFCGDSLTCMWIQPRSQKASAALLRNDILSSAVVSFLEWGRCCFSSRCQSLMSLSALLTATPSDVKQVWNFIVLFPKHVCVFKFLRQSGWTSSAFFSPVSQCCAGVFIFCCGSSAAWFIIHTPLLGTAADVDASLMSTTQSSSLLPECFWYIARCPCSSASPWSFQRKHTG